MMNMTKEEFRFYVILIGAFLMLKDVPVGELFSFATKACGL